MDDPTKQSIEDSASFLSWIFLLFLDPIFILANKKTLEANDLGTISNQDRSEYLYSKFIMNYELERKLPINKRSLWRPLWRTVGYYKLFLALLLFTLSAVFTFGPVLLLTRLVEYFSDIKDFSQRDVWIMVGLLFAFPMLSSLSLAHSNSIMSHLGCQIRNILINVIYRKSLVVSSLTRQTISTGRIITMFSEDTNQIRNFLYFFCNTSIAPLQIGACLYLIYKQVNVSTFVGLGYSIFVIPIAGIAFGYVAKVRKDKMVITDSRVKLINEILAGIRIIKFYAWELPFEKKIVDTRAHEIQFLKRMGYIFNSVFALVLIAAPQIQSILIFFTYVSTNHGLDVATAFTTLTLFGLMTSPFIFIPFGLQQYSQCQVAMQRIISFLDSPEIEKSIQSIDSNNNPEKIAIKFENASFSWGGEDEINSAAITNDNNNNNKDGKDGNKDDKSYKSIPTKDDNNNNKQGEKIERKIAYTQSGRINRAIHTLEDLNITIKKGQLVGIVGRVGSGKSSFLSAVLGEMHLKEGNISMDTNLSVAYCDQRPFVMNATVKDNVLFFSEFEEKRFNETLAAVCLDADIKILTDGIQTEIGERGITLSGGQKTRVSLARAVYSDADVYLLDDPLSAVDAHVGEHIFNKCVVEYLQGKTRLFVTHHIRVLPSCDLVIVLNDHGSVDYCGTYDDLVKSGIDIEKFVASNEENKNNDGNNNNNKNKDDNKTITNNDDDDNEKSPSSPKPVSERDRKHSIASATSGKQSEDKNNKDKDNENSGKALMTVEEKGEGAVHLGTYVSYMKTGGVLAFSLVILGQAAAQSIQVWANFFLINWGKATTKHEMEGEDMTESKSLEYLHRYAILLMVSVFCGFISRMSLIVHRTTASEVLHNKLLKKVLYLPVSFFDTTPIGRIINRFSQDMSVIDEDLASTIAQMVGMGGAVAGSIGALIASTKGTLLILVFPLAYLYYRFNLYFKSANTAMARLEAVSRSPIYADFSQTLGGTTTIRSFHMENHFINRLVKYSNNNTIPAMYQQLAMQWLSIRLDFIGSVILVFMGIVAVSFKKYDFIPAGYLALGLSYAIQLTSMLKLMVRGVATLEAQFNSVERLDYYINQDNGLDGVKRVYNSNEKNGNNGNSNEVTIYQEKDNVVGTSIDADIEMGLFKSPPNIPENWPQNGVIEFRNVVMQYRDLEPTLKNVSFVINSKEKVGIAGRTG